MMVVWTDGDMKRAFDACCACLGLLVLSPVIAVLSIAVWLEDHGPVFYRGSRIGRGGTLFRLLKYRSMVVDAESKGGASTAGDDPRLTRIGAFLRRYKLDEVPQLWNVLKGEMSFVGPRPEVLSELPEYQGDYAKILELRPGITDLASLWNADEGGVLAGAQDSHDAYKRHIQPTKLALQLKYYRERSFWLDLKLIFYTLYKIVRKGWVPPELRDYPPPVVPDEEKALRTSAAREA